MRQFFRILNHHNTAVLGCILVLVGMIYGRFILSVGSLLLITRAVINPEVKTHFYRLWKHKDFLAVASVFLLLAISFFWSDNTKFWGDRLMMKLPFLGMPIAFLAINKFDKKLLHQLFYFFFWLVSLTAVGSFVVMAFDYENIIELYSKGQVIPLPVNHIRFSLMVVFAICLGFHFYEKQFFVKNKKEIRAVIGLTVFLIIYLHLIAVRSGLLAFYGVLIYYLIRFFLIGKRKIIGVGLVVLFLGSTWGAYNFIPTLKNKVDYTWYSVNIFNKKKEMRELSDSRRLGSILAGVEVVKNNPILGVGLGDMRDKTEEWLVEHYTDLTGLGLMPHNQFLWILMAVGWLGFAWFMIAISLPFFFAGGWRDPLFISFNIILWSSFLVEHTLETQVGMAVYIFPLVMMMRARLGEFKSIQA